MTNHLAVVLLVGAFVIMVVSIILGVGGSYDASRSAATVLAEGGGKWSEQVQQLRLRHPEMGRYDRTWHRLDRHDSYVWMNIGLWMVGVGILLAPAPNTAVSSLSWDAQKSLALCILIGASVSLVGTSLGMALPFGGYFFRSISRNLLSEMLGDDVRTPYAFAWLGLFSTGIGVGGYGWTIYEHSTFIGTLGGGLSFAILGMCCTLGGKFVARIGRYTRRRNALLAHVATRIEEGDQ